MRKNELKEKMSYIKEWKNENDTGRKVFVTSLITSSLSLSLFPYPFYLV